MTEILIIMVNMDAHFGIQTLFDLMKKSSITAERRSQTDVLA